MKRFLLSVVVFVVPLIGVAWITSGVGFAQTTDYQRDVQPILAEHCAQCHGRDEATRQAGLRLDLREAALVGGESGIPAVVPGRPEESEIVRRTSSTDPAEMMPPPDHQKPLSLAQIETLKRWVDEGAVYSAHWAFVPPVKAALPECRPEQPQPPPAHPVDALVAARLATRQLSLAPREASATLCRRLYLDLIGLPPSPAELEAFERDGIEATVDALLASERFGEKWARHWLDAARYSDTNGYEKDLRREQWVWRDWVIAALNRDLPYDQFLIEQVAGDLLPNATQEQKIATGFLRNSMLNEEGAIVAEQFRMVEMFDRLDCLGKAVLGLTTQCAQCHSHKFDPLAHDEYYGLFAFLNNSYEAQSWVYTPEQLGQLAEIETAREGLHAALRAARPQWSADVATWEAALVAQLPSWTPLEFGQLESISGLNHPTQLADRSILMRGHVSADVFFVAANPTLTGVTGLRLEALTQGDLPFGGPGRSGLGTFGVTEIEAFAQPPGATDWTKLKLVNATADYSQPETKSPEGKNAEGPVGLLIDGTDETAWHCDRGLGRRNQPSVAVVQFEPLLDYPAGTRLKFALRTNDMLGCCRVSLTTATAPAAPSVPQAAVLAIATPAAERTPAEQAAIFDAWRVTVPELQTWNDQLEALWAKYPQAATSVLHLAERPASDTRQTHLLNRGGWDQPLHVVAPHTPAALHPLDGLEGSDKLNRLAFARWLADRRSPLTARVAVNRIWQAMFGIGLVETAEDFGTRAAVPEYRELLDWLAVDFMEHGWSQKHVVRQIATSATYQQASRVTPEVRDRDPRNQLLARGPRFRAEAEVVRDITLAVSGLLTHKVGGPGVIPPVPQNVLDFNFTYPDYWKATEGADRYRRTLYTFRKRSMPDPVMSNFDAPNGDFSCVRRPRSNTPLAALTGLNEVIFVEAARALGLRILREGGGTDPDRAAYAFRLCTARWPEPAERDELLALLQSRRQRLAEGWLNIREVATGDAAKLPELPPGATPQDAAAWTLVARVLLNLDETITKN